MRLFTAVFILFISKSLVAQQLGVWSDYLPYKNAVAVSVGNNKIYCGTQLAYFTYDKNDLYLERQSKSSGLSDLGVKTLRYNRDKEVLVIGYSNGNIDLVEKKKIVNLADIKRANITGEKKINHVLFLDNFAYLSCSFGIVVIDLDKYLTIDTYRIGPNGDEIEVFATSTDGSTIMAATEIGIFEASLDNGDNLLSFSSWHLQETLDGLSSGPSSGTQYFNNAFYGAVNDTLFSFDGSTWNYVYSDSGWSPIYITSEFDNLVLTEIIKSGNELPYASRVTLLDKNNQETHILSQNNLSAPLQAVEDEKGNIWVSDLYRGLVKFDGSVVEYLVPNGPSSSSVFNMSVVNNALWVTPGGVDGSWGPLFNRDGVYKYEDFWWSLYNESWIPELEDFYDILGIAVKPLTGEVYFGSFLSGLGEWKNNQLKIYNKNNSPLLAPSGDSSRTRVAGLTFDKDNNLWIANNGTVKPLAVMRSDGTWKNFSFPENIRSSGQIIIDEYNQKWVVLPRESSAGIAVFGHDDLDDSLQYNFKILKKGVGQGNLHSNDVICLAMDNDGEIWVGTEAGVTVFYCAGQVFQNGCDANRILVEQDGVYEYLLVNEYINTIAIDGANRKWVGTANGAFLISEDGTEQIEYFNENNSPLLSNNVIKIVVHPDNGTVYFGTDKGLCSFVGDAIKGKETHDQVIVFPNPVREDYSGPIAIRGLVENAFVKITDISGRLIYEGQAFGGQAIWDGNNYRGERAKTGVYLVFSTDRDGLETHVAKLLIIN